jgi:selenium-binding protein 1
MRRWNEQFYPEGIRTWFVKADAPENGSLKFDPAFFVTSESHRVPSGATGGR